MSIMKNKANVYTKIMGKIIPFFQHQNAENFQEKNWPFQSFHLRYATICQNICPAGFPQKSGRIPDGIFF